jgi:UDPglucose 6-dehydrogenase
MGAARGIGAALAKKSGFHVAAVKSTVPPGTSESVSGAIARESGKKPGEGFGVCMNPEFLKEGDAVRDFMDPDRIVIGAQGERERAALASLYSAFSAPMLQTDLRTAEMIKYASNAFLATKISFMNEMANGCERLGIDVYGVADGMGLDKRIGRKFLDAGAGWGGSCFGKDASSLAHALKAAGCETGLLEAAISVNASQPLRLLKIARAELGTLKGKRVALLGLAFKPETDDMRDAPSEKVARALLREGAEVCAYDPQAEGNARKLFEGAQGISFAASAAEALKGADACIIITEWKEFARLSAQDFKAMKNPFVIEGRRVLLETRMPGVKYRGIGRISHG